ncbi:hypothetical protein N180_15510 [Pedobacter antarcticus 4BY]|uniref:Uncharacterized protein n=1 Tax=Pedobacter antarcticus 4BY TaxID=1358423 RepID=A0A081PLS1_9SPHI|nr:hypothetical protein N180_15510 [Pedobacter antarcticus 4BY]
MLVIESIETSAGAKQCILGAGFGKLVGIRYENLVFRKRVGLVFKKKNDVSHSAITVGQIWCPIIKMDNLWSLL